MFAGEPDGFPVEFIAMVLVMVIVAALFFFAADQLIGWLLRLVLSVGQ